MDLKEIKRDLDEISANLEEIRPDLDEISPDLDRSDKIRLANTPICREQQFRCVFRSGRLKIDFPCSKPSTDQLISSFRGANPLPTVASVKLVGSRAGLGELVRY